MIRNACKIICVICLPFSLQAQNSNELDQLLVEVALLSAEVELLEAEEEIENLQRIFGFYFDKRLWTQAADLFADDGSIELGGSGVYTGKDRVLAYLATLGDEGPAEGILFEHMQLQPVVSVSADGTAKGRWHHFSQEAVWGESHHWGAGTYENTYVKEGGIWKIQSIHLYSTMRTPYDDGWAVTALPRTTPSTALPPDLPPSVAYENYPAVFVPPFHYQNPVTGNSRNTASTVQVEDLSLAELTQRMDELDTRITRLSDADEVERLQTVYGYYLARNQWDELTGIFAEDGTIEIAMRGVYEGHEGIRRNLNLYGVQGELPGTLHNHMQYQPVIHIQPDGETALIRSRAFSMMGSYEGLGMWMGGTYENTYSKEDGVWKLKTDQVFNTYFASYNEGWINLERREPPGITDANPPDAPPTADFEMYPSAFLPPFHYANPVTGRQ